MGKRKYTPEFKQSAVALVLQQSVKIRQAADDLGIPHHTLTLWVSQARQGKGAFAPPEQMDLTQRVRELEAENRRLKIERDILKKATAFFVKEEGGRP